MNCRTCEKSTEGVYEISISINKAFKIVLVQRKLLYIWDTLIYLKKSPQIVYIHGPRKIRNINIDSGIFWVK